MDAREFGTRVEDLEKKLDRLRALYEQYFMGIEKIEPGVLRRDVERHLQGLRKERCNNTAQRFRFQVLLQRYTTLTAYWQRICRAIEEGTYHPHVLRAQRRIAREPAEPSGTAETGLHARSVHDLADLLDLDLEPDSAEAMPPSTPLPRPASMPPAPGVKRARSLEDLKRLLETSASEPPPSAGRSVPPDLQATLPPPADPGAAAALEPRPVAAPTPTAGRGPGRPAEPKAAPPAAARHAPGAVPEDKVRSIHAAFAAAGGAAAPSPAAIRRSLEKELDRMSKKHPGKRVDFRVDLKDGKPVIKSFVS
ncbi:MAG: hypothetical protein JXB32_02020 [Deltaproteobacteria bacterium]|nr:hypothetical protein [Deltaproteobacteria bacterium]